MAVYSPLVELPVIEHHDFKRSEFEYGPPPWWANGQRWFKLDEQSRRDRLLNRMWFDLMTNIIEHIRQ